VSCTILPEAQLEVLDAATWYESRRVGLGDDFIDEFERAIGHVTSEPSRFGRLETYSGVHDVRRCMLARFPYLIVFLQRASETVVVAVSHVRRRPLYWLDRFD
jgi:hypothetical protein